MATAARPTKTLTLVRRASANGAPLIELEVLAREAGLHPDLVRRFEQLGLVEGTGNPRRYRRDAAARLARASRLRRDLALNYAGAVLACELLARIDELEERLSRYEPRGDRSR
ncbi:MAG: chaperone modulatory protein CbpM [Gaiellales bacterium]|jgi:DNA-binding transcriptional MerR regulator|nr:chaperone modulatory protein CbpM [Gaiellales bacterium]